MALKARLTQQMKEAMKARDSLRLTTIRMALTAIKNKEIEQKEELDDQGVTAILSTLLKQRREAAEAYRDGGRTELAEKEEAEIAVLQDFLPEQLSAEEIGKIVDAAIEETGASSMKDMGAVMKVVMAKTTGQADGKVVSSMVRERLAG
ncbi:MAG: GatB/YqeY domain-containing protein [Desulfuromonadales bacterium]|nr:GatB/YqeY domain-containing protein [Desulfuromonadales bacterium]NIR34217.1 GatB/YqeY domain-containing protein [Desulfuromonadales bacterium]NIS41665.1 GatB/YqeY domain-containing protein [Desulfuromonadales bacterium]